MCEVVKFTLKKLQISHYTHFWFRKLPLYRLNTLTCAQPLALGFVCANWCTRLQALKCTESRKLLWDITAYDLVTGEVYTEKSTVLQRTPVELYISAPKQSMDMNLLSAFKNCIRNDWLILKEEACRIMFSIPRVTDLNIFIAQLLLVTLGMKAHEKYAF